ncbi:MAG: hypothetical protein ABJQ29_14805 [Luteolibacter sp.]
MKKHLLILTFPLIPLLANGQEAQPVFRDAATHEQLIKQRKQVLLNDPMKALPEATGEDASVVNKVGNLLENSDVLSFNGQTTLVPKNALVLIPEKFESRINRHEPGAAIVSWLDFYKANRGWISTVEVTFEQARGDAPVSPEILETLGKSGNLIVAVLKAGPISVVPPKTESLIDTASQTASQTPEP